MRPFGDGRDQGSGLAARVPCLYDAESFALGPGNIRELQNFIERAVILTDGDVLHFSQLPSHATFPTEPVTLADRTFPIRRIRRTDLARSVD
jgi:hypothetical protein